MEPKLVQATGLLFATLVAWAGTGCLRAGSASEPQVAASWSSWNPRSAAAYLDRRAAWWIAWQPARRDHETFCISCHTALPYALGRPSLRAALGEKAASENESRLLESVSKRVRLWKDVTPFYTESSGVTKTLQSRGTESVLNALILASVDARSGKLSDDTRTALHHMWALQARTGNQMGAWPWLNFGNEPFEAKDSPFYGASLAAVTVGMAPENYRATPEIQNNLKLLGDYIRREFPNAPLIHQVVSLWACEKWPGLLSAAQQKSIVDDVLAYQESDGGWSLSSLGWTWRGSGPRMLADLFVRSNDSPLARKSDGYATGLIVFVLAQMGVPHEEVHLQRGRSWLMSNQDRKEGLWPGYSLVNRRDPSSGTGRFMNDAATAYAVLALTSGKGQ
jgi:squalene-hopene/tetraprenyl-beta-curcumene cyclase